MIGHFGNNAIEFMRKKRVDKPKEKNVQLLKKYLLQLGAKFNTPRNKN